MFKKIQLAFGLLVLGCVSSLQGLEILPEAKAAYFYPTHHRFRDIHSGGGLYSIEASMQTWDQLYSWASVGYFQESGSSIGEKRKTKIQMVPLTLGLKYILPTKCLSPYLGAGLLVSYVDIRNHSPYVRKKDSKWGVGGICKLGCLADISQSFFIDVFCDYSYLKVTFGDHHQKVLRHKTDLSGLSFGGGLGYRF